MCIRYWMKYVGIPSKQEQWVNSPNLPCKAELFSPMSSAWNCLIQGTFSRSRPWLPTTPSASPPCSSFSPFSLGGWEMLFIFWKLTAVLLCLWFPEEWLCGVSEQLLRADPGWWHTSLGTLSITLLAFPLRQEGYLSNGMTHFSALSVLKYQVSELIESRWAFLQKKV